MNTTQLFAAVSSATFFSLIAPAAHAIEWSDTQVQALYGGNFKEPATTDPLTSTDVRKATLTLQSAIGWTPGFKTFAFVDLIKSNRREIGALSGEREKPFELYGEAYGYYSLGQSFGPVRDVNLEIGYNGGRKNSELSPRQGMVLGGLNFDFDVGEGRMLTLDVLAYKQHRYSDAFTPKISYRTTYQLTPAWDVKWEMNGIGFYSQGYVDFIGPLKNGSTRLHSQIQGQPQLLVDVGRMVGQPADAFYAGVEWTFWRNKYGIKGLNESAPQLMVMVRF